MPGLNDSLSNQAVPAVLVVGPCAAGDVLPPELVEVAARGLLRVERVAGPHEAAARIATGRAVAGVLMDVASCSGREVAAISIFTRAGVAVWLLGTDRKPARAADAIARGGQRWSSENLDSWQIRTADVLRPESIAAPQEERLPVGPIEVPAREDGTMETSASESYDDSLEQPLVSNEEMRALLGASE